MSRLQVFILLTLIGSALYLVHMQYESRALFVEYERAKTQAHKLEVEANRLEVEKRAQATPLRVEKLAKDKLQMQGVTPAITHYVSYSASAAERASP